METQQGSEATPEPESKRVVISLNNLVWGQADLRLKNLIRQEPNHENFLEFLSGEFNEPSVDDYVKRYQQLSVHDSNFFATPAHPLILRGIHRPIHQAKAAYILGHFVGCIGLCGVASEMLAIFRFQVAKDQPGGHSIAQDREKLFWGMKFERLGQQARRNILLALELIDGDVHRLFGEVAGIRNNYLHLQTRDAHLEQDDALKIYKAVIQITIRILGLEASDKGIVLHPHVLAFLHRAESPGQPE